MLISKTLTTLALLALSSSASWAVTTVYLLAGQSNMDGRADISGFSAPLQSPLNSVDYYYGNDPGGSDDTPTGVLTTIRGNTSETGRTGPAVPLAHHFKMNSTNEIAIIKYGNGGSGFSDGRWISGGNNTTTGDGLDYRRFQNVVSSGLSALQTANPAETFTIGGFVWVQGERDAVQGSSTVAYQNNLTNFITDVRATYGTDMPFFFSRLSDNQTAINATGRMNVQAAQDNVDSSVSNTFLLNTDSFGLSGDNLHFNAAGYTALGEGLSQAIIDSVPEPSSTLYLLPALSMLLMRRR